MTKDTAAQELAKKRWAKVSKRKRKLHAAMMNKKRWGVHNSVKKVAKTGHVAAS